MDQYKVASSLVEAIALVLVGLVAPVVLVFVMMVTVSIHNKEADFSGTVRAVGHAVARAPILEISNLTNPIASRRHALTKSRFLFVIHGQVELFVGIIEKTKHFHSSPSPPLALRREKRYHLQIQKDCLGLSNSFISIPCISQLPLGLVSEFKNWV